MKFRIAPMSALLLILAACGDDPSGTELTNTLTRAEALGVAIAYLETLDGSDAEAINRPSFSMVPDTTVTQFEGILPCARGGTIQLATQDTVIFDQVGPRMAINIGGTHTAVNCGLRASSTNVTINGAPHFTFSSRALIIAGMPSGPVIETLNGNFAWTTQDGRSGSCSTTYQRTINPLTGAQTETGTICGYSFTI
jgi:hypothetical protein